MRRVCGRHFYGTFSSWLCCIDPTSIPSTVVVVAVVIVDAAADDVVDIVVVTTVIVLVYLSIFISAPCITNVCRFPQHVHSNAVLQ